MNLILNTNVNQSRKFIIGFLLLVYMVTLIIYSNPHNTYIANYINMALLAVFAIDRLLDKEFHIYHNVFTDGYALFVLWSAISCLWSPNIAFSIDITFSMFQMAINNYLIYNCIKKYDLHSWFIYGIVIALALNYLHGFGYIHLDVQTNENWRFEGSAGNSNEMGLYIVFGVILSLLSYSRDVIRQWWVLLLLIPLSIYFAILTGSRKTTVLLVFFAILYFVPKIGYLFTVKGFFYSILLVLLIGTQVEMKELQKVDALRRNINRLSTIVDVATGSKFDGSLEDRKKFLEFGKVMIAKRPLEGYGIGSFVILEPSKHYSHNNYIELLFGVGIVGFFIYYFGVFEIMYRAVIYHSCDILFVVFLILIMELSVVTFNLKPQLLFIIFLSTLLDLDDRKSFN